MPVLMLRLLNQVHGEVLKAIESVLANEDPDLVKQWRVLYGDGLNRKSSSEEISDDIYNLEIARNVCRFYAELPQTSPVKASVISDFFADIPVPIVAEKLNLAECTVRQLRTVDAKPLVYYLRNLGIPRNRLGASEDYVIQWLDNLQVPSGMFSCMLFYCSSYFKARIGSVILVLLKRCTKNTIAGAGCWTIRLFLLQLSIPCEEIGKSGC